MKYLSRSFSTSPPSQEYRDNWEKTFGKKQEEPAEISPVPSCSGHYMECDFNAPCKLHNCRLLTCFCDA